MARSPPAPGTPPHAIRVTAAGRLVAGVESPGAAPALPLRLLSAGRIFPGGTAELVYAVA